SAVNHWQKTGNKSQTARLFEINRNTLNDWIKLYQAQGHTKPKPFAPVGVKHIITDLIAFEDYVNAQEFDTAKQLREQYLKDHPDINISYNAFLETLRRIKWSFKKRPRCLSKPTP
ncbi:helix-turn-helix domain-containing protein, partial [Salmonella enterica subsp. enterica serovar Enteritidis]|nr:helix-turn-helix domain-containing protein [Salmonella enterica subsp. enterica serovar Enteritidis]